MISRLKKTWLDHYLTIKGEDDVKKSDDLLLKESEFANKCGYFWVDSETDLYYTGNNNEHTKVVDIRISGFKSPFVWVNGKIVPTVCLGQLYYLLLNIQEPKYQDLLIRLKKYQPKIEVYVNKLM